MKLTRRKFLIGSGLVGGGLIIGLQFKPKQPIPNSIDGAFQANAWLQITDDGRVIFQLDKAEMGQGVLTSLAMTIGEELDYNPSNIIVELAGIHPSFINTEMGAQLTGASTSTKTTFTPLREAGANARAMLLAAAAKQWQVDVETCTTDDGMVMHLPTAQKLSYGELASLAKSIKHIGKVTLKEPSQFRWIGTALPRIDAPDKVNGKAIFGIDVQLPGLKIAVIKRCPQAGGIPLSYDTATINNMPGIQKVFTMHSGIAIIADSYWQARNACNALQVVWNKGALAGLDSDDIHKQYEKALEEKTPRYDVDEGEFSKVYQDAHIKIEANFSTPFFHHSPMEPQNTTAIVSKGKCEVWSPSQAPDLARGLISAVTGIKRDHITVNTTLMGGAFGRRGYVDFAGEAGAIAVQYPDVPVKLIWSREDDMQHDFFRGYTYHAIKAALDKQGNIVAWQHQLVSTSIAKSIMPTLLPTLLPQAIKASTAQKWGSAIGSSIAEYDPGLFEGARIAYNIPNRKVGAVFHDVGIPTGFWRSVGHFHNAFVVESFIDECAHAAGRDPAEVRREYLKDHPRHLRVLEEVLTLSQWGKTEKHLGLAVHESFSSFVAQVVEVKVEGKQYTVEHVYCAVDCGLPLNPNIIKQQMESGIVFGLTAAMKAAITFKDGAVEQSNFHDLPVLRMDEMPKVDVVIITSTKAPSGLGETGVPPVTPALANALFAATGQRLRTLPLVLS